MVLYRFYSIKISLPKSTFFSLKKYMKIPWYSYSICYPDKGKEFFKEET
jgi:hypothetical protein